MPGGRRTPWASAGSPRSATSSRSRAPSSPRVRVAYETWGTLNDDRSNAVYICHALTGDSHVAGSAGPGHRTGGWWHGLVGPGCAVDTDEWFVVCANVLGGCQGTTGPSSLAPDGRPWGSRFPVVTVPDMVEVEYRLTDLLGIRTWALMLGPSLGGMRVLEWMVRHPDRVRGGLVLGSTAAVSADQIGTHAVQIDAILADPAYRGGDYYDAPDGEGPHVGMGIARRIAHLTYRCETELGRALRARSAGRRGPLRRRPVRRRVVPRSPRRQAGPAVRRQHLRGAHPGDEPVRPRAGPRRHRGRARGHRGAADGGGHRLGPALPGAPPAGDRGPDARCGSAAPAPVARTATTASSSRTSRWGSSSPTPSIGSGAATPADCPQARRSSEHAGAPIRRSVTGVRHRLLRPAAHRPPGGPDDAARPRRSRARGRPGGRHRDRRLGRRRA